MPMTPRSGESQQDFIARCMHGETGIPTENNQRFAACMNMWRQRPKEGDPTARGALNIRKDARDGR